MDDPRFKHVTTDPRFKTISKKSRKVAIDSRFQSMFTGEQFKIRYKVDKRGRKVNHSSSEDLRKYYELEGSSSNPVEEEVGRKEKGERANVREEGVTSTQYGGLSSEEESDVSSVDQEDESSSDEEEACFSGDQDSSTEVVEDTWREQEEVATADATSCRLAVCNMDWDHLGARDIYVLLSSFKPAGSSILSVAIYPSNFGLERIAHEEVEGPVGLVGEGEEPSRKHASTSKEGKKYSEEKLRQYQLSRLKYYYAVVECDVRETAEHIYEQSNGLEFEHSGGQLDLRFVPDGMTFDDRDSTSQVNEGNLIASDYKPPDFVSSAVQQSKVKLTWDETDPKRLKVTQRKFTKDDLQSMDFSAYLASSSSSDGEGEVSNGDKAACYKALLEEGGEDDSEKKGKDGSEEVTEEMEITWEHGLKASAEDLVKKMKEKNGDVQSPWEAFLKKRKEKRKEAKRQQMEKTVEKSEGKVEGGEGDSGFDDPFFQHDVTTTTAKTAKRSKVKRKKELSDEELQSKRELELLVMSDEENGRQHFNLPSILRSEKNSKKKRKRKMEKEAVPTADEFKVDVADDRFKAMYESHLYAPDPSAPQYRATKGMGEIMEERSKRVTKTLRKKLRKNSSTTDTSSAASVHSLVESVKAKTASFQMNKRKPALASEQTKRKRSN